MAYIDADYYTNIYQGIPVEDPDMLNRMIARASDVVDQLLIIN